MQTTSFKKVFLGIIGGAVLLSSGTVLADDKGAHFERPHAQTHSHHKPSSQGHCKHPRAHHAKYAQNGHREQRLDSLRVALQLTPNQVMSLRVLFNDHHAERKALRHKRMKDIRALLTPQQRHHWRELREERKAYWKSSHRF
jgi:hypothetical protein